MTKASFSISVNLLVVKFTDTTTTDSGVTITSLAWDFGVTPAANSTAQNPSYTYSNPGKYTVTLTVVDSNGTSTVTTRSIIVDSKLILPVTIEDLVKLKLPTSFPYRPEQLNAAIVTWQFYIQPLVNSPGVSEADINNELAYPPIVNALVGYIVAYQILLDYVSSASLSAAGSGVDGQEGVVKRIETGPSNAEFRDTSDYLKYMTSAGGIIEQVKTQMCALAFRCMIQIPYCSKLPTPVFVPKKSERNSISYNLWEMDPSEIVTSY